MRTPEIIKDGKRTGKSLIGDVDGDFDDLWYESMKPLLDPDIFGETSSNKGGPKSGHWGHAGRPGERGGSKRDPMWLPGLKPTHPNQQAKADKIAEEEKQREEEREWSRVTHGYSPRNSLRSGTLAESEKELQSRAYNFDVDFRGGINTEKSASRTFLLEMTGAAQVWFGEGFGSRSLYLRDKNGQELMAAMHESGAVNLTHLFKSHKGGMLGVKFMRAMKRYADITGNEFRVVMVANPRYFSSFPWLKENKSGDFVYRPSEKVELKGGPGSGNFEHAGRPGQVGGSSSEYGKKHELKVETFSGRSFKHGERVPTSDEVNGFIRAVEALPEAIQKLRPLNDKVTLTVQSGVAQCYGPFITLDEKYLKGFGEGWGMVAEHEYLHSLTANNKKINQTIQRKYKPPFYYQHAQAHGNDIWGKNGEQFVMVMTAYHPNESEWVSKVKMIESYDDATPHGIEAAQGQVNAVKDYLRGVKLW